MSISEERYSFAEVAKMLDVSLSSVWRWHLTGTKGKKLQSVLVGGRRFVLKSQLDAFCGMPQTASASQLRCRLAARKLDARMSDYLKYLAERLLLIDVPTTPDNTVQPLWHPDFIAIDQALEDTQFEVFALPYPEVGEENSETE